VAGGGSGARRADRVPTTTRARPRAAASHAARRTASDAPLSSRAASRCLAQRAALCRSGAITSADPASARRRSTSRRARDAPTQTSGGGGAPPAGSGGGAKGSEAPLRGGGGSSAWSVEPHGERLSSAAQRERRSTAADAIGADSTARSIGLSDASSPS